MLNSKQRAYLRALANSLSDVVQIGKSGVTPETTVSVSEALEARELVKISVLNNSMMEVKEVADIIHERTRSEVVQIVGNKIVLFRKSKTKPTVSNKIKF